MTAPATLTSILDAHVQTLQTLLVTLDRERGALHEQDAGVLEQLTAEKSEAAGRLRDLGLSLERLRAGATAEPLDRWLTQHPQGAAGWQHIRELGARCQAANRENAAHLEARMRQTRGRLQALRGETAPPLYGQAGPVADHARRLLGQA